MNPQLHPRSHEFSPIPSTPAASVTAPEERDGHTPNSGLPERIPEPWAWHYRALRHMRDRLVRAHAEHATQAVAAPDMPGGDVVDGAQEQTDRDLLWAELGNEADRLFEVDCALQRIRAGTYGFCEATGYPIRAERLRAIPWTRYSLAAAQPIEMISLAAKKHRG
jgi:RNA polymerase-binding transcription factor DksA